MSPARGVVFGIDPGLDVTGVAAVQPVAGRDLARVVAVHSVRTSAKASMGARLSHLHDEVGRLLAEAGAAMLVSHVVVEVPAYLGTYRERTTRGRAGHINAAAMAGYFQALGVVRAVAAASGVPVVELPPGTARKGDRQALYARWTREGRNDDERDAICVALASVLDGAPLAAVSRGAASPRG